MLELNFYVNPFYFIFCCRRDNVVTSNQQEKMLSVSGKKKCSHCGEELGNDEPNYFGGRDLNFFSTVISLYRQRSCDDNRKFKTVLPYRLFQMLRVLRSVRRWTHGYRCSCTK